MAATTSPAAAMTNAVCTNSRDTGFTVVWSPWQPGLSENHFRLRYSSRPNSAALVSLEKGAENSTYRDL